MLYERPRPAFRLTPDEKKSLLLDYFEQCRTIAEVNPSGLNVKIPRDAFHEVLDEIGALIVKRAAQLSQSSGAVREFLDRNPLPPSLKPYIRDDYRCYSLLLNALKQWLSAEQAATDRYLLGGTARAVLKDIAEFCVISGEPLKGDVELHHPLRDGRPPIPVSPVAHATLEGQRRGTAAAPESGPVEGAEKALAALKRQRNASWVMLRKGCLDVLGREPGHTTPQVGASSRAFARKAHSVTGWPYEELLDYAMRMSQ